MLSCSSQENFFYGKIDSIEDGKWIFLEKVSLTGIEKVDSCQIKNSLFSFNYVLDSVHFYRITLKENNFALMALKKGDTVHFTANASNLFNYSASGNNDVEANTELFSIINSVTPKTDSLRLVYQTAIGTKDENQVLERIREKYNLIMLEKQEAIKQFIDKYSHSFISIIALQELGDVADHIDYYKKVSTHLSDKYPNDLWVIDLTKRTMAAQNTAIGAQAPNFSANDKNGKKFTLKSMRGSFVLIDFWASWCGPCRRENPLIVELYNQFHSKGLEIVGVSLDDTLKQKNGKQDWLTAIENDQLTWIQVSELQGFESYVCKQYGVESIPSTFLINKDGIIIARNLRGTSLRNKLIEIFD